MSDFEKSVRFVISHEGNYSNNPNDPGGETKYGISKRSYPYLNIKSLTLDNAKDIYYDDYWTPLKCGSVDYPLNIVLFDSAVNCGVITTIKWLQSAVDVVVDGYYGPITTIAVRTGNPYLISNKILSFRLQHYVQLSKPEFLKGWVNRVADLLYVV